jgi:hypothetical protein
MNHLSFEYSTIDNAQANVSPSIKQKNNNTILYGLQVPGEAGVSTPALMKASPALKPFIDEMGDDIDLEMKHVVNQAYRRLAGLVSV